MGNATSAREVAAGETATGHGSTLLVGVATLALAASLLTRGLAPALPGVWVGVDHLITALKLVSAIASQLFAVCSTALVIALVLAAVRSRLGAFFRSLAVGVGVLTILGVMAASAVALPEESRLVLAVAATALALLAGFGAVSRPALRGGALVLAAVGVAGVFRVATIGLAYVGDGGVLLTLARITSTLGWSLVVIAVFVASLWRFRRATALPFQLASVAVPFVVGILAAVAMHFGGQPDAGGALVLLHRTLENVALRPTPHIHEVVAALIEGWRWALVVSLLFVPRDWRHQGALVAFALLAAGSPEIPLCAAATVIATLLLALQTASLPLAATRRHHP